MTQEEFDTRVAVFVNKHLCRTNQIASFDISKDPYTSDLKTREKFFENVIYSLNGYDLSLALFSEKELSYLFELGMLAGRSCGKCTDWFPRIRYTPAGPIFTPVSYGLLYNWYAATDERNITNSDEWCIPEMAELYDLLQYIQPGTDLGENSVGEKLRETGIIYWMSPNTGATNEFGFNARGSGYRDQNGNFYIIREEYHSLTKTLAYDNYVFDIVMLSIEARLTASLMDKKQGSAIRIVRLSTEAEQLLLDGTSCAPYIGNDGKVYRTVKIGTQVWIADNLCETLYRNGDPISEVTNNAEWAALTSGALCAYNNDWNNV